MRLGRTLGVGAIALLFASGTWIFLSAQSPQTATPPATGFLAGQIIDSVSRRPIDGVTVGILPRTLLEAGRAGIPPGMTAIPLPRPVVVDAQGRFFFSGLAAGNYSFQVSKTGYLQAGNPGGRAIEIAPGERITDLKIRLTKLGSLAGTVRDDAGDPIVGTLVVAMKRTVSNGRVTTQPAGTAKTDDRGAYRVPLLQPGEYVICACIAETLPFDGILLTALASDPVQLMSLAARAVKSGADAASLDSTLRTYAPTFYPSSSAIARATRLKLSPGEERSGADIDVAPVRATRVSGTIVGATSPLDASSITLWPAEGGDDAVFAVLRPMLVQADGRFDFTRVPPGQYVLRVNHAVTAARGGNPSGTALVFVGGRASAMSNLVGGPPIDDALRWAAEPITVGESGISGLIIDLREGPRVRGRMEFVGSAPQPTGQIVQRGTVTLLPTDSRVPALSIARLSPDLTFQMARILPGRYSISSVGFPGWPTLKSVIVGGQDVTDLPIELDEHDLSDVVLTFSDAPLSMLDATLSDSRPADEDLSVLVFPSDRKYWGDIVAGRRRFRSMAISRKGNATITGLPAGEYFIVVVTDDAAVDWQELARLDAFSRTAQRVTLAEGEKKTLTVRR